MNFILSKEMLKKSEQSVAALFYEEDEAFNGVKKVAKKVMQDIELVLGDLPTKTTDKAQLGKYAIIFGTIGRSTILTELDEKNLINLSEIKEKREVFLCQLVDHPIGGVEKAFVIAGSDKRGTIYGLFHLSERLGVSPLVNWNRVYPQQKNSVSLGESYHYLSKEPSVKYRGFFINDEWPAFGNWTNKHFDGFNADMYEHVFELLLRLKGNYLWPAMWSARFNDDGPGLANAELANEYGVIMGASHHEPCLRYGEEYKYLRGEHSIYGDSWNFIKNREGITKFWQDGLKRTGHFENVITMGMRGEADTSIMGKESTLADNIQLLRDVLETQNDLIENHINPNLSEVPRMLALYKEVEPFFYGDKQTAGLKNSEELENVILMLCDDNHGNLRTLPTEEMRKHSGGYGMYYHFDYHGGPISYEWINSSYLPKIWEQMTMAYDFGVRDLWIVNVGDIATQEFPLSYFLDLAYDFEKWGTSSINKTDAYTQEWGSQQFSGAFEQEELQEIFQLLTGYTKIAHKRRPETMNVGVYHPVHYQEADITLQEIEKLLTIAEKLYEKVDKKNASSFFSLVYYPAVGNLNLQKMWLLTEKNHHDAKLGKMEANKLADRIRECLKRDRELVEEYHSIDHERWFGMGLSEHIGFQHWNEEECQNPITMQVWPANKPRLVVSVNGVNQHTEGPAWHNNQVFLNDFLHSDRERASFTISSLSELRAEYEIVCEYEWLSCSKKKGLLDGIVKTFEEIEVKIDRQKMSGETVGEITVSMPCGTCKIIVHATREDYSELPKMTFIEQDDYISIEAEHYFLNEEGVHNGETSSFQIIEGYGKTLSAVKAFPTTAYFSETEHAPYLEYNLFVKKAGTYSLELYTQPSNPVTTNQPIFCGIQIDEGKKNVESILPKGFRVDDPNWAAGVLNNIHRSYHSIQCQEGLNKLKIFAVSPGFVLEKLVIYQEGKQPPESYLGPTETYYVGRKKK
ncbi:hypothetical protein BTS2_0182 [Bacillus sp. TS-2]|nr:hypothetical protein BTS2_0182 [Bacillus sp. TS-2]